MPARLRDAISGILAGGILGFGTTTFLFAWHRSVILFNLALCCCFKDDPLWTGHTSCLVTTSHCVKNVNPSTPRVHSKSTLSYKTLRQTQTPTVVATPQLLGSLQCQIKGTCSTPTPKCTSELLLFSPDATVTRNRSTRTKDGTQPRNTNGQHSPEATKDGNCFTCPR